MIRGDGSNRCREGVSFEEMRWNRAFVRVRSICGITVEPRRAFGNDWPGLVGDRPAEPLRPPAIACPYQPTGRKGDALMWPSRSTLPLRHGAMTLGLLCFSGALITAARADGPASATIDRHMAAAW